MTDGFLYEKLVILNNVYNNTIVQGKTLAQASVIKTQLFPHQKTLVNSMHIYRDKMTRGFILGNQAINGKIGIIGDPVGTGKTLSMLAYLVSHAATFPRITCELGNNSSKYFFSHELYQLSDISSTNLIIVPHNLFNQWTQEIVQHTTISYVSIETRRIIKGTLLAQNMINSNFVLTTNKCYKFVQEYANQHGIQWNNIIIDEASSIYINSSDPKLRFQFLWFVTSNWLPLIFKNPFIIKSNLYYLKDRISMHPEFEKWLLDNTSTQYEGQLVSSSFLKEYLPLYNQNRGSIVIRNSDDLINMSINLPEISNEIIQCRPNISINTLSGYYLSRNYDSDISSSKIPQLFQALNIKFNEFEYYLTNQLEAKHELIKRKMNDGDCAICLDHAEYPTMVNCCYNLYCAKCLLRNMITSNKCPTCRDILANNNICCLKSLSENEILLSRSKIDVCLDIFKNNRNGKFIIYSSFDNIYYQLFEEINRIGLKAERIENNLFLLLKTIRNFKEGRTNIIFVSNINLIRGISFGITSHLIFFHELLVSELKQVLIHSAHRIGRRNALKIIHLHSEIQI